MQSDPIDAAIADRARAIALLVLDVDGVLTDGRLYFDSEGGETKVFNVRDGHGIVMLRKTGVRVAAISGRSAPVVERRLRELGADWVYQGCQDKRAAFADLLQQAALPASAVCYVGDDLPDLVLLRQAGLAVAVSDADERVIAAAHLVTRRAGGTGAVREVCELLMSAQGTLAAQLARHE